MKRSKNSVPCMDDFNVNLMPGILLFNQSWKSFSFFWPYCQSTYTSFLNLAQRMGTYSHSPSKTSRSSLSIAVSAYAHAFLGPIAVPFICLNPSFSNSVMLFSKVISRASIMQSVEKIGYFLLSKFFY